MANSLYSQWNAGTYSNPGSFAAQMFEAFRHADGTNRDILTKAFPYLFEDTEELQDNLLVKIAYEWSEKPSQAIQDRFNIPHDDTAYMELEAFTYPIHSVQHFRDQLLESRRAK